MSNPKKPLNEVHMFSDLSLTARRIISQLLESNEILQKENQLLKNKTKESLNGSIRLQYWTRKATNMTNIEPIA